VRRSPEKHPRIDKWYPNRRQRFRSRKKSCIYEKVVKPGKNVINENLPTIAVRGSMVIRRKGFIPDNSPALRTGREEILPY
jgi:hypothetical protein